jgi:hypothetical protein
MKRPAVKKRKRIRSCIVGQGDDRIPHDAWDVPISNYKELIEIYMMGKNGGFHLPLDEITSVLKKKGYYGGALSSRSLDGLEFFLTELLSPYFDVTGEHWDSNAPGASGIYKRAVLTLGNLRLVNRRLCMAQAVLIKWHKDSGLPPVKKKAIILTATKSEIRGDKEKLEGLVSTELSDRARAWEESIANEIIAHVESQAETAFIRFHFLSYRQRVFFIQKTGWFHSIPGDELNIAELISSKGIDLIPVEIIASARGWVPYFARNQAEEGRLGWNEESIKIKAISEDDVANLHDAIQAVRSTSP